MHKIIDEIKERKCCKCGIVKSKDNFHKSRKEVGGIRYNCKICIIEYSKKYYLDNKDKIKEQKRKYYLNNKNKSNEYSKRYNFNHKDEINEREKKHYKEDIGFRLNIIMNSQINYILKRNGGIKNKRRTKDLLNYDMKTLKMHLEKTMPIGYTWDDYLNGKLHIDHIIPISAFNIVSSDCIDFRRAWDLNNLRLLPKIGNIKKGAKISKPFQPALGI